MVVRDNLLKDSVSGVWFDSATDCLFERNTIIDASHGLIRFTRGAPEFPCRNVVRDNIFVYGRAASTIICSPEIPCELRIDVNHWHCPASPGGSVPYVDEATFEKQKSGPVALDPAGISTSIGAFGREQTRVVRPPEPPANVPQATRRLLQHSAREMAIGQPLPD